MGTIVYGRELVQFLLAVHNLRSDATVRQYVKTGLQFTQCLDLSKILVGQMEENKQTLKKFSV